MITGPDNLFGMSEFDALLREELARLPVQAARRPAGRALLLQACAANRGLSIDARHLAVVRVHAEQQELRGDVACDASALPWEDDAFQLVFAQHVGDVLPDTAGLMDELARVLAPGGVLLWFGLNAWSPWLAWVHWHVRRGLPAPRAVPADAARAHLLKRGLAPARTEHLGSCWPQRGERQTSSRIGLLDPLRGVCLIVAEKQRAVLTPLRPRALHRGISARPQLATPSRRASA